MAKNPVGEFLSRLQQGMNSQQIATEYSNMVRSVTPSKSESPGEAIRVLETLSTNTELTDDDRLKLDQAFSTLYRSAKERERVVSSVVKLDAAEKEALLWVALGLHSKEIATRMLKAKVTIEWYLKKVREKFGATTMSEAVSIAHTTGVIGPEDLLRLKPAAPASLKHSDTSKPKQSL